MKWPTLPTHGPIRTPAGAAGREAGSMPRNLARLWAESASPLISGTCSERSRIWPLALTRPGFSWPADPKRTSFIGRATPLFDGRKLTVAAMWGRCKPVVESGFNEHVGTGGVAEGLQLAHTGLPGLDAFRSLALEPFEPVRPPGAGMFLCLGQPGIEIAFDGPVRPELVFGLCRRVDDPGDVPRSRHHELDRAAEELGAEKDPARRRNMVLAGREVEDWDCDVAEIELEAVDLHLAPGEIVFHVAVAQIEGMVGR